MFFYCIMNAAACMTVVNVLNDLILFNLVSET